MTKTIVYRANYRVSFVLHLFIIVEVNKSLIPLFLIFLIMQLDGGHHEIWCDHAVKNFTRVLRGAGPNRTTITRRKFLYTVRI